MPEFLLYIIEIGISLFMFYSIYWIFLKNETYFKTNRYYIIMSLMVALIIPSINIPIMRSSSQEMYFNLISTVIITADGIESVVKNQLSSSQLIIYGYVIGVIIFSLRFIIQIFTIVYLVLTSEVKSSGRIKYVLTKKNFSPFSFFNYVFISKKLESSERKKILAHESIHARQYHSIDIIVMEVLAILQWFNPFIWFYKNSLQEVHEYLADQGVIKMGFDPKEYQKLIFEQVFGIKGTRLANSFNYSLTKRRFIMMTKIKSPKSAFLKFALLAPVVLLTVLAFSCSNNEITDQDYIKVDDSSNQSLQKEEVYLEVDVMPQFPGGDEAIRNYIASNVHYPAIAKELGVQGKVFIQFVVNKKGKVVDIVIARGISDEYSKDIPEGKEYSTYDAAKAIEDESIRVLKGLPDWVPGKNKGEFVNVQFTVPINFLLE